MRLQVRKGLLGIDELFALFLHDRRRCLVDEACIRELLRETLDLVFVFADLFCEALLLCFLVNQSCHRDEDAHVTDEGDSGFRLLVGVREDAD